MKGEKETPMYEHGAILNMIPNQTDSAQANIEPEGTNMELFQSRFQKDCMGNADIATLIIALGYRELRFTWCSPNA